MRSRHHDGGEGRGNGTEAAGSAKELQLATTAGAAAGSDEQPGGGGARAGGGRRAVSYCVSGEGRFLYTDAGP